MNKIVDANLYSKIISFASDIEANFPKLKEAGFNEDTQLHRFLKEYSLIYRDAGSGPAEILGNDLPFEIQKLYENDKEIKDFFDSHFQ